MIRCCLALRVPSEFFEIIRSRAAPDAHPCAAGAHAAIRGALSRPRMISKNKADAVGGADCQFRTLFER